MAHPLYQLTPAQRETIAKHIAAIDTLLPQRPVNRHTLTRLRGNLVAHRRENSRTYFAQFWHEYEASFRAEIASAMRQVAA